MRYYSKQLSAASWGS